MSRSESGSALFDEHPQSFRIRSRFSPHPEPVLLPGGPEARLPEQAPEDRNPGGPTPRIPAASLLLAGGGIGVLSGRVEPTTVRHRPLRQRT